MKPTVALDEAGREVWDVVIAGAGPAGAVAAHQLAARGADIHERLCSRCHLPPHDPDVADALGIPLHGQRGDYLRYALESYLNGNREHLLPQMGEKISELSESDIGALVDYYVRY